MFLMREVSLCTLRVSGLLDVVLLGAELREAREYRHRVDVHLFVSRT